MRWNVVLFVFVILGVNVALFVFVILGVNVALFVCLMLICVNVVLFSSVICGCCEVC